MKTLHHKFIELAPPKLESGILYVSLEYCTVMHLCPCGCGNEIVTPIAPDRWQLSFDGESITLHPSIGNEKLPCKTHYWIKNNKIVDAGTWGKRDFKSHRSPTISVTPKMKDEPRENLSVKVGKQKESLFNKVIRWLFKR